MQVFCELFILHSTDGAAVGARGFLVVVVVDEAWREAECESHRIVVPHFALSLPGTRLIKQLRIAIDE